MAVDITQIWINLSTSIRPIEDMLVGISYLMGLLFMLSALKKYHSNYAGTHGRGEGYSSANAHLFIGSILIFLPSSITMFTNTFFINANPLSYAKNPQSDWMAALAAFIQVIGLAFFIRGCAFVVESSDPQSQTPHTKGIMFMAAGVLGMNFLATIEEVNKVVQYITSTPLIKGVLHYIQSS